MTSTKLTGSTAIATYQLQPGDELVDTDGNTWTVLTEGVRLIDTIADPADIDVLVEGDFVGVIYRTVDLPEDDSAFDLYLNLIGD